MQYGLLPRLVFVHTSGHLHWIALILLIGRHRSPSFHFSSVAPCLFKKNSDGQTSLCNLNHTWNILEICCMKFMVNIFITLSYLPISYLCCVSILLIFWCRCTLLSHNASALQSSQAITNKKDIVGWFLSSLRMSSLSFNWVQIEHWYIISCNFISCYWAWPFYGRYILVDIESDYWRA